MLLRDICTLITKGTTPTTDGEGFTNSGINFIKSESLSYRGNVDKLKFARISEKTHLKLRRSQIHERDILYSIAGVNLGKCGIATADILPANTNQAVAIIRVDREKASPEFISYVLRNKSFVQAVLGGVAQSAQPNVNLADIGRFVVPAFKLNDQHLIASVLGALDDKIELNRRMNETLEAMARAIFKDWFVDFGPTRAKAEGRPPYLAPDLWSLFPARLDDEGKPEGWTNGKLSEIATQVGESVSPEALDPGIPYIGLEHMPRRSIALETWEGAGKVTSGKLKFHRGDFLFGKLRPYFHKVGIAPVNGICSTDIIVLTAKEPHVKAFVICCISQDEYVAYTDRTSDGTKMPRTSWGRMGNYEIMVPNPKVLEAFDEAAAPMLDKIIANILESKSVSKTRDLLLPKLMSGEIRVRDTEALVEAAE